MSETRVTIRRGTYYDSLVLMQVQAALAKLAGVQDAGVMMGTEANKALLEQSGLLAPEAEAARPDDLLIVVRAGAAAEVEAALGQVDSLLARRRSEAADDEYRPQSLETALRLRPDAQWVLVSVPGRYAAGVAREALRRGRNVFLYSDNVAVEEEVALKQEAASRGLLVMGPDCGTAIINGVGLGFANHVRRGSVGVVAASGTGLQAVTVALHGHEAGITHALGTGGRDLSEAVGALTTRQALDLLGRDPATRVIVLISKPPAPAVAEALLEAARNVDKPVVVAFIGHLSPLQRSGNLYFARTFDEAAEVAARLAAHSEPEAGTPPEPRPWAARQRYLRGLFSGGTLAYEAQLLLAPFLRPLYSNAPLDKRFLLDNPHHSQGHSILDLGEDVFTVGRLHPMMDNDLRLRRLRQEADDPEVALILLDVVLGYGAHPDPAAELAPAIAEARAHAARAGRHLEVVAMVIGTPDDPQNLAHQMEQLSQAGAHVNTSSAEALRYAGERVRQLDPRPPPAALPPVPLSALTEPLVALNVGLELFADSLAAQGAAALPLNWRPPAGGDERLMAILERLMG